MTAPPAPRRKTDAELRRLLEVPGPLSAEDSRRLVALLQAEADARRGRSRDTFGFTMRRLAQAVEAGERKRRRHRGAPDLAEDLAAQIVAGLGGSLNDPQAKGRQARARDEDLLPTVVALVKQGEPAKVIADVLVISASKVVELKRIARTRGLLPRGQRGR